MDLLRKLCDEVLKNLVSWKGISPSVTKWDWFQDPMDTKIEGCSSPLYKWCDICIQPMQSSLIL